MRFPSTPALRAASVLFAAAPLLAQSAPPNAGNLMQNMPREPRAPSGDDAPLVVQKPARASSDVAGGASAEVRDVKITGNTVVSKEALRDDIAGLAGKKATLADLRAAADRVTARYHGLGYPLARAYVPAQTVEDGVVEIAVLEGRYGEVTVNNASGLDTEALKNQFAGLKRGQVVSADELDRAMLLASDRAGARVQAQLRPGVSVGASDLAVEATPGPRVEGGVFADNYGNRYTGAWRAGADASVNSPLGFGDRFDASGTLGTSFDSWDAHQLYGRLAYQTPVGSEGTVVGAYYSAMGYGLGREFAALDAEGTAQIAGVFVSQNLIRSRKLNVSALLGYEAKFLDDRNGAAGTDAGQRLNNLTLGLSGDRTDSTGVTLANVSVTGGFLDFDDPTSGALDALTAKSEGGFYVLRAGVRRYQRLADRLTLLVSAQGQWSPDNLASAEKTGLGGPYGVRAYPVGDATGDASLYGTVELRYAFADDWRATAFYDGGWVKTDTNTWSPGRNERYLGGPGLGLNWSPGAWSFDAQVALRTDGPAQSEPDHPLRYWLRASYRF